MVRVTTPGERLTSRPRHGSPGSFAGRWRRSRLTLDNGIRSPRKLLRAVVARLLGRKP